MKVTLIQLNIKWNDIHSNIATAEKAIRSSELSDLYILPEMFSTGFDVNPSEIAEGNTDGEALTWMKRMAKELNAAIAGSIAVKDGERYFNRLYFVKPEEEVIYYNKRHLFSYGNEDKSYTPGTEHQIVEWRGVRFMLQICYDLRFPVFSRNIKPYYDCCIYVASWPESRRRVWDTLLMARAIENQCYVLAVNRVGDDPICHYNGGTQIIDPYGRCASLAPDNKESSITFSLDIDKLFAFRKKFPS